jgi:hypothetical protein
MSRRTRSPRVWMEYWCWKTQFWMSGHKPYLPMVLRNWAYSRWGGRRWSVTPDLVAGWRRWGGLTDEDARKPENQPLPWPFGPYALGPFVGPWDRVSRFFRQHTGGRSHRCEFTDKEHGALYGHKEGPFMDAYFDRLLENISDADIEEETTA